MEKSAMAENQQLLGLKLKKKRYDPTHVCEVGVYLPETCSVRSFILAGKRATLVEANPVMVEKIEKAFKDCRDAVIYSCAISDKPGHVTLYDRGPSTFIETVESPALINDDYIKSAQDQFVVEAKTFDQIDDGTIDLLCIDIEGAEWFVLSKLKSKPNLISIETHGKYYVNPKIKEIEKWMKENGFEIWYKDKSDSVYVKSGIIPISNSDKISLLFFNLYLNMRRVKGLLLSKKK